MARSIAIRYPRGGSPNWLGDDAAAVTLRASFFGVDPPPVTTALAISASTFTGYTSAGVTTSSPINVTIGDRVVVFQVWQYNNTPPDLTDSQSGVFTTVGTVGQSGFIVSGGSWFRTSVREITSADAAYTITATKADGYTSLFVVVVSGAETIESTQLNDVTAPWSHSITTTGSALILGFVAPEGQAALSGIDSTPTGFTELHEILSVDYWQGASAYQITPDAGTYTWTPSITGATVASSGLMLVALYGNAPSSSEAGYATVWNGSAWVRKPLKVWNGSAWVIKPLKYWNGSTWALG